MSRFFIPPDSICDGVIKITGVDASHIALSLRMRVGEPITLCDGCGNDYSCVIKSAESSAVTVEILGKERSKSELPVRVHLFQSVPKGDKFELIVQKAVELGVYSIIPVISERCISRPDEKSAEKKRIRLQTIAKEAAGQCGRGIVPRVERLLPIKQAFDSVPEGTLKLFCYEGDGVVSLKSALVPSADIAVFVGPEGGYAASEVQAAKASGYKAVNLGQRILRCETAPLFALSCIGYKFEL